MNSIVPDAFKRMSHDRAVFAAEILAFIGRSATMSRLGSASSTTWPRLVHSLAARFTASKHDPKSNIVEHPEVVAQRIETVVAAVGDRERVIAGVDCGFGTFVGWEWVTEDVMWAKLATLRAGAEIASKRLWSRKAEPASSS
jgi:hypothetical protein